ncbi:TPA: hypothetical protein ACX6SL_003796 [Photobacterium damselae]
MQVYICFFIFLVIAFYFPIYILGMTSFVTFFLNSFKGLRVFFIFLSLTVAFFTLNLNAVGDTSAYYNSFYKLDHVFGDGKYYRYVVFNIINFSGLNVKFYTFLNIFLAMYFLFCILRDYFKLLMVDYTTNNKFLFIFVYFSIFQFSYLTSYENFLAFVFFAYGLSLFFLLNRIKRGFCFVFLSVLIHPSLILFVFYLFVLKLFKRYSYIFFIKLGLFFSFLFFSFTISSTGFKLGIEYFDKQADKLYIYLNGVWSNYSGLFDYTVLFYSIFKMLLAIYAFYILYNKKDKNLNSSLFKFIILLIPTLVLMMQYRTMDMRYIFTGTIFFYYVFLYVLIIYKPVLFKIMFVIYILLVSIFPFNFYGIKNALNNVNVDILSTNIIHVINSSVKVEERVSALREMQ